MNKKDKNIWNKDILGIYPKGTKHEDKYDESMPELWLLIPIYALIDWFCVAFKIGTKESRAKRSARLRANSLALFILFIFIIIIVVAVLMKNI